MKRIVLLCLFMTAAAINSPIHAHHSFAATFTTDTISVEGVVVKLRFVNPHVLITLSVKDDDGEVTEWVSEGGAASLMRGRGWGADTLKPGDYIRITGNSTRNGSPMISIGNVEFVNALTGEVTRQVGQAAEQDEYATSSETTISLMLADGVPNFTGTWIAPPQGSR